MSTDADKRADRGDGWDATRRRVLERDDQACRFCGVTDEQHRDEHDRGLHAHHIIPKNDGGSDDVDNLITVCCRCHRTLEETHAKALVELDRNQTSQRLALARSHIAEAKGECEWLWGERLPRLSDLPAIEGRDLPGETYSKVNSDALTDREKACYILGRIQGYSHLGTHIEAVVDHIEPDEIADRIVENYDDPKGFFSTPSGDDDPEFNNGGPW